MTLEEHAKEYATRAHAAVERVRKYTGEPYISHPSAVVELVRSVSHTPEMIAAAWLHDVVEDTGVELDDIEYHFGPQIAALVEQLTDVSQPENGNRAARKAIDREHTAKASPEAKTIKLADLIDNSKTIIDRAPNFAKVYLIEKGRLLTVLREGDPVLWRMANQMLPLEHQQQVER